MLLLAYDVWNKKLITRWKYPNFTWRTSFYLFTYLRLATDMHWTESSPIRHKVHLIQLKTFELELHIAEYTPCPGKKMGHLIFDNNSRTSWSIFTIFLLVETKMNTPQFCLIYLLNSLMTSYL